MQGDQKTNVFQLAFQSQPARSLRSWWSFRSLCFSGTKFGSTDLDWKGDDKTTQMREVVDPAPGKLTWHLKNGGPPWTRRFLLEIIIFRVHVTFRGCVYLCIYSFWWFLKHQQDPASQFFGLEAWHGNNGLPSTEPLGGQEKDSQVGVVS